MTSRRSFLRYLAAAPAALRAANRPPNVVFILADDLGWGDLGCYGHRIIKTPNLDRLARQGTLFTQFYVNGPVCSPSRTAFMTGRFPARLGIHSAIGGEDKQDDRGQEGFLDARVPTVTRNLKAAGYVTAHFGKWHLGAGSNAPRVGDYGIDVHKTINGNGPSWDRQEQRDPYFRARSSRLIVDESIRFIEQNRDKPFYVNVWSLVPHATLNPTDEQMQPYERLSPAGVPHKSPAQIYSASVTDLDQQIGRLLAKLDELGLADNTLVLFSSDNGPEDIHIRNASHSGIGSNGPFRGQKRSLYEGGIRLPFIARWPGHIPANRVENDAVVSAVDLLPTACKLAAVTPPEADRLDGEAVDDVLFGKSRGRSKPIMWEWRYNIQGHTLNKSPMLAIREGNWKLLLNPDRSRVELYDIPRDPSELNNLADRKPEIVKPLAEKALAWQKTLPGDKVFPEAGRNDYPWPKPQQAPARKKKQ
jgi:N-acetylgalactosamine-6-sulfatase